MLGSVPRKSRSLSLDLRLPGLKRFVRTIPSRHRRTLDDVRRVLRHLWTLPEHRDLVVDIANGRREVFDVYLAAVTGKLNDLPSATGPAQEQLEPLLDTWLAMLEATEHHRHNVRQCFKVLTHTAPHATPADLPRLLETYRAKCVDGKHPSAFNRTKAAVRAFLRDLPGIGKRHPLYLAAADVPGMRERKESVTALTVKAALAVRERLRALPKTSLGPQAADVWWTMCTTGMGPSELWGEWEALPDRVRIVGTKRPGRSWGGEGREVPLVAAPVRPSLTVGRFAKLLRLVDAKPRQGRKSYSGWLEDAEIPRTRRRLYLGHGAKDVTDLYEKREITAFLTEDASRLARLLAEGESNESA
jgi:hypothetical protein